MSLSNNVQHSITWWRFRNVLPLHSSNNHSKKKIGVVTNRNGLLFCSRSKHTIGYQGSGSFHSENVDDLMNRNDKEYVPPELPFDPTKDFIGSTAYDINSNIHMHTYNFSKDYLLDKSFTFINHGAFGAALKVGYDRSEQWRYYLEQQPLRYFDRDLLPHLVYSARRLAKFCSVKPQDRNSFTIIQNVTSGLNAILRGYCKRFKDMSHVMLWDTTYGSLKKMSRRYCDRVTEIPVSEYFHFFRHHNETTTNNNVFEQALLDTISKLSREGVDSGRSLKNTLLIMDHTTSNTALNMNLESLSRMAKEHGMLTVVDGAHSLLAQEVNLGQLENIDFYVANGHKWLSCPRGIGILYCPNDELRDTVLDEPAVMSHGVGDGYQSRFLWDGCRDYAAALSVPAVLDYWESHDIKLIQNRIKELREDAVTVLGTMWHPSKCDVGTAMPTSARGSVLSPGVTLAPLSIHSPMMVLVRLPERLQRAKSNASGGEGTASTLYEGVATSDNAKQIQDYLYDNRIEVPIKCIRGILYVRISCHVYNELSEYEHLGTMLLDCPISTW